MKSPIYYSKRIGYWLLDALFPLTCLSCKKKGSSICTQCASRLRRAERETSRNIIAAYDYRDPVIKKAIWSLKYHTRRHIGDTLGQLLYESTLEDLADMRSLSHGQPLVIIPIPLSSARKKVRGYNQAEIIARSFCECAEQGACILDTRSIIKKKDTQPQAKITNRTTRLKNIHGAFSIVAPEKLIHKTVIVIDDVTTTGGTITEVLKLLKEIGVKKAVGFAVAH